MSQGNSGQESQTTMRNLRGSLGIAAVSVLVLAAVSCPALAVDATWNGTTDAFWATLGNWAGPPASVPGTGNTATFNNAGNGNTTIDLGGGTIKYTANSTADSWMKTLTNAYVFPGAVTIDTQNRTGTISQILEKATGIGVTRSP